MNHPNEQSPIDGLAFAIASAGKGNAAVEDVGGGNEVLAIRSDESVDEGRGYDFALTVGDSGYGLGLLITRSHPDEVEDSTPVAEAEIVFETSDQLFEAVVLFAELAANQVLVDPLTTLLAHSGSLRNFFDAASSFVVFSYGLRFLRTAWSHGIVSEVADAGDNEDPEGAVEMVFSVFETNAGLLAALRDAVHGVGWVERSELDPAEVLFYCVANQDPYAVEKRIDARWKHADGVFYETEQEAREAVAEMTRRCDDDPEDPAHGLYRIVDKRTGTEVATFATTGKGGAR